MLRVEARRHSRKQLAKLTGIDVGPKERERVHARQSIAWAKHER
jgi:hypothetical protein